VVIKALPSLHTQVALFEIPLKELARLGRDVASLVSVMLLNVQDDIQPNHIHLLKWPLWRLEHAFENCINLFRSAYALGGDKEGFSFDGSPNPVGAMSINRGMKWQVELTDGLPYLLYRYPIEGLRT
jgi:hypothetical protein